MAVTSPSSAPGPAPPSSQTQTILSVLAHQQRKLDEQNRDIDGLKRMVSRLSTPGGSPPLLGISGESSEADGNVGPGCGTRSEDPKPLHRDGVPALDPARRGNSMGGQARLAESNRRLVQALEDRDREIESLRRLLERERENVRKLEMERLEKEMGGAWNRVAGRVEGGWVRVEDHWDEEGDVDDIELPTPTEGNSLHAFGSSPAFLEKRGERSIMEEVGADERRTVGRNSSNEGTEEEVEEMDGGVLGTDEESRS
ncbi:hypothetical protein HK101_000254, partial [Irineochytrium annulatum]